MRFKPIDFALAALTLLLVSASLIWYGLGHGTSVAWGAFCAAFSLVYGAWINRRDAATADAPDSQIGHQLRNRTVLANDAFGIASIVILLVSAPFFFAMGWHWISGIATLAAGAGLMLGRLRFTGMRAYNGDALAALWLRVNASAGVIAAATALTLNTALYIGAHRPLADYWSGLSRGLSKISGTAVPYCDMAIVYVIAVLLLGLVVQALAHAATKDVSHGVIYDWV